MKLNVEPLEAGVLTAKMFNVQKPEDATIVMLYGGWSSSTGDADWGMRPMLYTKVVPAGAVEPRLVQQSGDGRGDRGQG